ncbi:MAG: hypothetical protein H3C62_00790 [Gemmatimonadaceae bacterium]|nr:hypothetical protein [Gemmatimonadaceae bacterium]
MPTRLKPGYTKPGTDEFIPAQTVVREIGGLIVTLTVHGLCIREKGRRVEVGPLSYETLYRDSLQRANGLVPIKPRARGRSKQVSRGLLAVTKGR